MYKSPQIKQSNFMGVTPEFGVGYGAGTSELIPNIYAPQSQANSMFPRVNPVTSMFGDAQPGSLMENPMGTLQDSSLANVNWGAGAQPSSEGFFGSIGNWMNDSGFLGKKLGDGTQLQGWGGMAIGAAQGLANAYMGMKQYGLAKDTFNENKRQFELNFNSQKKLTNSRLEDRQRARVASNPGYQSVDEYMKKNGI